MEAKKNLVFFVAMAALLLLAVSVSAKPSVTSNADVYVRGVFVESFDKLSVTESETIPIRVVFTSGITASDVKVKAEIDGYKVDVEDETERFDIESGRKYSKSLSLTIPFDLKDELSNDATLSIKIFNKDYETELSDIVLRVQRDSYNVAILSIDTVQSVEAGQLLPVDVVIKNRGYNDLDDMYVTAKIPALGVERRSYFGDIVALECNRDSDLAPTNRVCDEDEEETLVGRIFLQIPENVKAGTYTIEVEAKSDDVSASDSKQISVESRFAGNTVLATVTGKTVSVSGEAEYGVLIVNPSNKLKVYRIVPESASSDLSVSVAESVVAIPAGSSKTVKVLASSQKVGIYNFNVNVFSGEELVNKVALSTNVVGGENTSSNTTPSTTISPVVILTVVLAIVFIVLLVVLLVLVGKKPEKSEEFGESYY